MSVIARFLTVLAVCLVTLPGLATAQAVVPPVDSRPSVAPTDAPTADPQRQTLADVIARQNGEGSERQPRHLPADDSAAGMVTALTGQLGTRGETSDPAFWEDVRFSEGRGVNVSAGGDRARVLVQQRGMWWLGFRAGPLRTYGGYLLLGTIGLLAVFYLLRGRIRITAGRAGVHLLRFTAIERFAHWLLAGSFLLLAFTGLISLFGRNGLIPIFGHQGYATLARVSKLIHDNVSWAFMLALVMVFVFWVIHNLPDRTDLNWIAKGGGFIGHAHPPAKKFNFGQKLIFWAVVILGASISVSGLSLLFPMEWHLFSHTFGWANDAGAPGWFGYGPLPDTMAPQEEMQYSQLWHAIIAFLFMAVILAHIYIGTLGMEGAFEAMGTGEVDLNWAREHHSLWAEKVLEERDHPTDARGTPHPAE